MNKSIELKSFIHPENELYNENSKLEIKKIDKSEELDTNAMKKCLIVGVIFVILVIVLSIIAVNYVLKPNKYL